MRISDWSSDVCSSDLPDLGGRRRSRRPSPDRTVARETSDRPRCLHLLHQRRERVQPGCGDGAAAGTRRITPARVEAAPAASFWPPSLPSQGGGAAHSIGSATWRERGCTHVLIIVSRFALKKNIY